MDSHQNTLTSAYQGSIVATVLVAQALALPDPPIKSSLCHDWPPGAVYGIETQAYHMGFGMNPGEKKVRYFDSPADYDSWKSEAFACIREARILGVDTSLSITLHMWIDDLQGPQVISYEYLA
jgi:hypothetical protein